MAEQSQLHAGMVVVEGEQTMRIDKERFLFAYQGPFGPLEDSQKEGLDELLSFLEADEHITDIRHAAYMLATAYHETGKTFKPIAEYGRGRGKKYGIPDPETAQTYYGRGYVQLTWKGNYDAESKVTGVDLIHNPDLAMQPEIAYKIMSGGMRHGSFTGVGLSRYIHDDVCDYLHARKIINGMDCAEKIADYAEKIEKALRDSEAAA
jgi:putative chitinase